MLPHWIVSVSWFVNNSLDQLSEYWLKVINIGAPLVSITVFDSQHSIRVSSALVT